MKKKLSLQDFAEILAQREDIDRKAADAFARSFFDIIEQGLQTDKFVKIKGFGTFKLVAVSERESVNINTGERFQISGHTKVSFTPDSTMKELVNRPFAHFEAVDLNDDTDTKEFEVIDEEMEEEADEEIEENQVAPSTDEVETTEVEELESGDDTDNANNDNGETEDVEQATDDADEPIDNESLSDETPIEIITDQAPSPTQQEEVASATLNKEPSTTEPNITPTTSVTDGNKAKAPSPTAQTEAINTAAIPNKHRDREDIVVTEPTPISNTQATNTTAPKTTTVESAPTNATMGYTYNEVPSPHKRNWWKTLSLILLMLALMAASYFAGYYRMLCPTCDNYIFRTKSEQPVPVPTKVVQPGPVARPASDSDVAHADTAQKANQKQSQPNNESKTPNTTLPASTPTQQPAQTKPSQLTTTSTPQRPKTHCVGKGENIYRIARKYYGDDSYAQKIIKANNLKDANTIVIGMELKLP